MTTAGVKLSLDELARAAPVSIDRRGLRFDLDGRVLRAFDGEAALFFRELLSSPDLERLFEAGLVRFWTSDVEVDGFDLVVESERVPITSYPQEWPTTLLHEAGLCIARLGRALAAIGLGLKDAHPWNVLFADTRAVWIDVGSIAPVSRIENGWVDEFRRHIVLPLAIRSLGWHTMADALIRDHPGSGAKAVWDGRILRRIFPPSYRMMAGRSRDPARFHSELHRYLEARLPRGRHGEWSNYEQAPGVSVGERAAFDAKQRAVDAFLSDIAPGTVLDVGANKGWYSELAASYGHRVVAVDMDDVALGRLYARAREQRLAILPLRMDIMWPTGSHGLGLAHAPATERLRSDVTLWLAVVHHFAGRQHIAFETIARTIDRFTTRTAIVEFIPAGDVHVRTWPIAREPWYNVDSFVKAMSPYFGTVHTLPSSPTPRVMLRFDRAQ